MYKKFRWITLMFKKNEEKKQFNLKNLHVIGQNVSWNIFVKMSRMKDIKKIHFESRKSIKFYFLLALKQHKNMRVSLMWDHWFIVCEFLENQNQEH